MEKQQNEILIYVLHRLFSVLLLTCLLLEFLWFLPIPFVLALIVLILLIMFGGSLCLPLEVDMIAEAHTLDHRSLG